MTPHTGTFQPLPPSSLELPRAHAGPLSPVEFPPQADAEQPLPRGVPGSRPWPQGLVEGGIESHSGHQVHLVTPGKVQAADSLGKGPVHPSPCPGVPVGAGEGHLSEATRLCYPVSESLEPGMTKLRTGLCPSLPGRARWL